jgi:IS30 family transposase
MIKVALTSGERAAVQALRRDPRLRPAERDRVEMILLSAEGWSPPRIARHLSCHPATVRQALKRFAADGTASLRWRRSGPPKDEVRRRQVTTAQDPARVGRAESVLANLKKSPPPAGSAWPTSTSAASAPASR